MASFSYPTDFALIPGLCYTAYKHLRRSKWYYGYYPSIHDVMKFLYKTYKPSDLVYNVVETNLLTYHVEIDQYITLKKLRKKISKLPHNVTLGSNINEDKLVRNIDRLLTDETISEEQRNRVAALINKDTKLRAEYEDSLIKTVTQKCTPKPGKQMINITLKLDPLSKTKLEEIYPEFEINFLDSELVGHPMAAASRILESALLLKYANYNKETVEKANRVWGVGDNNRYNDLINDVGGNYTYHANTGNTGIHSCCPRLTPYDSSRETLRMIQMNNGMINRKTPSNLIDDGVNFCNNVVQRCTRTAPIMIAVQSLYDIPMTTLCAAMFNKGTKVCYASVNFDPTILERDIGMIEDLNMHFKIDRKARKIQFFFDSDTSFGYTHDLDNYLEYIVRSNVQLGENIEFTIEKLGTRCGVMTLRIVAIQSNYIFNDNLFFPITDNTKRDMVEIEFYEWDYSIKRNTNIKRFKRSLTRMPRKLYKDVAGYALTIKDGRFNPSVITEYMRGMSSNVVHTGKAITRFEHIDPKDLAVWSNAIYFQAYRMRWEMGKITQLMVENEKTTRDISNMGIVTAAYEYCRLKVTNGLYSISKPASKVREAVYEGVGINRRMIKEMDPIKLIEDESSLRAYSENYKMNSIQWYFDLKDYDTKLSDIIKGEVTLNNIIEFVDGDDDNQKEFAKKERKDKEKINQDQENVIHSKISGTSTDSDSSNSEPDGQVNIRSSCSSSSSSSVHTGDNWYKRSKQLYSKSFLESVGTSIPNVKENPKLVVREESQNDVIVGGSFSCSNCCFQSHPVVPNIGNGNCFFYSVLGNNNMVEALNMRRQMCEINWQQYFGVQESNIIREMLNETTRAVDDRVIEVFADVYKYNLRIHTLVNNQCKIYSYGNKTHQVINIFHRNEHFERIKDVEKLVVLPETETLMNSRTIGENFLKNVEQRDGYIFHNMDTKYFLTFSTKGYKPNLYHSNGKPNKSYDELFKSKLKENDILVVPMKMAANLLNRCHRLRFTVFSYYGWMVVKMGKLLEGVTTDFDYQTLVSEIKQLIDVGNSGIYERKILDSVSSLAVPICLKFNISYVRYSFLEKLRDEQFVVFDPEKILKPRVCHELITVKKLNIVNEMKPNQNVIFVVPHQRRSDYLDLIFSHTGKIVFTDSKLAKYYSDILSRPVERSITFNRDIMDLFDNYCEGLKKLEYRNYTALVKKHQKVFPRVATNNGERKLLEILERFVYPERIVRKALDLGSAPGGFLMAIKRKYPGAILEYHNFTGGDLNFKMYDQCRKFAKLIQISNGDLLDDSTVARYSKLGKKYDLVTADARVHDKHNHELNLELVTNEVFIAINLLLTGGTFIIKLFYDSTYSGLMDVLAARFGKLYIFKPDNSNIFSKEVYLVCLDYGNKCHLFVDEAVKKFSATLENIDIDEHELEGNSETVSETSDGSFNIIIKSNEEKSDIKELIEDVAKNSTIDNSTVQELVSVNALSKNDFQPLDSHIDNIFITSKNRYKPSFERNEVKEPTKFYRNSLREICALWEVTTPILLEMYTRYYQEFGLVDCDPDNLKYTSISKLNAENKSFYLVNSRTGTIIFPSKPKLIHMCGYMGSEFITLEPIRNKSGKFVAYRPLDCGPKVILCGPETELMLESSLLRIYYKLVTEPIMLPKFKFLHIQGVTGGGKSTLIGTLARASDLVLTSTVANKDSLQEKCPQTRVLTMHSYLLNKTNKHEIVIIDEASMRHMGEIILVAKKCEPRLIVLVGDVSQLKFFSRIPTVSLRYSHHGDILPVDVTFNISHRIPCDIAYIFKDIYKEKLLTTNKCIRSASVMKYMGIQNLPSSDQVLVFTRAEKSMLIDSGIQARTIGEIQGCTFDVVVLVRLNKIPGEKIFSEEDQILVGLTRHKKKFIYVTALDDDHVSRLIKSCDKVTDSQLKSLMAKNAGKTIEGKTKQVLEAIAMERTKLVGGSQQLVVSKFPSRPMVTTTGYETVDNFVSNYSHGSTSVTYQPAVIQPESPKKYTNLTGVGDVALLQSTFDRVFPHHTGVDAKACSAFVDSNPVLVLNKNLVSIVGRGLSRQLDYDCVRPALRTNVPAPRQETQKELLLALDKRNLNVPDIDLDVDQDLVIETMIDRFVERVIYNKPQFHLFRHETINISTDAVLQWFEKQDTDIPNRIKSESLDLINLNKYQLTMKSTVKPQLDLDADKEYNAPQTVVYKEKEFNLLFAPIFKEIKNRLNTVMDSTIKIYTDLSPDQFCTDIKQSWNVDRVRRLPTIEIDFKKFDKCQHSLLFKFELELYRKFGMPEWMVQLWKESHEHTKLKSYSTGIKLAVNYQRKSGDPATLLGNTLVSMGMVTLLYDYEYAMFVGDDVSLFGCEYIDRNEYFTGIFGMESKVFSYKHSYFCSKFMLFINGNVYFLPDPIKLLVKLGRHDLRNSDHVEEYRISTLDLIGPYSDSVVAEQLAIAVAERYNLDFNIQPLISELYALVSGLGFSELYYSLESDVPYTGILPKD